MTAQVPQSWDAKFRAIPDAKNIGGYVKRMSARPHHLGSAYDKDNAEWILSQFKAWGWELPSFNAYSIDGDVTGPLVYVNYGHAVKAMPGVREAIEQKSYAEAEREIVRVAVALQREATV